MNQDASNWPFFTLIDKIYNFCFSKFGESKSLKIVIPKVENGHLSLNAPMVYSQAKKPQDVYKEVKAFLSKEYPETIECIELANNFINIWFKNNYIDALSRNLLDRKGKFKTDKPRKINVEYISANPTGTLHLGHLRGMYGDMLANLLEFMEHEVTREYYVNNIGHQVDVLAESVFYKYSKIAGLEYPEPVEQYPGPHILDIAKNIYQSDPNFVSFEENKILFKEDSIKWILELTKKELEVLNIHYDVWRYEADIYKDGQVEAALRILTKKGYLEYGIPDEIEGKQKEKDKEECLIFRIDPTEKAKVVQRKDGSYTYFAGDLGYYCDKVYRGYNKIIMFLGADHDAHGKYLKKAVAKLELGVELEIITVQIMIFQRNGDKLKFSKRDGVTVSPSEILEYIRNPELLRFIIASRSPDSHVIVDIDELTKISMDNPYYYIQYAHARSRSVMRNFREHNPQMTQVPEEVNSMIFDYAINENDFDFESYPSSMKNLLLKLLQWPHELRLMEQNLKIHRLTNYLYNISQDFHSIWNEGKIQPDCKWLVEDEIECRKRLALLELFQTIMSVGLKILGITAYESMYIEKDI